MPFGLTGLGQGGADADLNSEIRSNGGVFETLYARIWRERIN